MTLNNPLLVLYAKHPTSVLFNIHIIIISACKWNCELAVGLSILWLGQLVDSLKIHTNEPYIPVWLHEGRKCFRSLFITISKLALKWSLWDFSWSKGKRFCRFMLMELSGWLFLNSLYFFLAREEDTKWIRIYVKGNELKVIKTGFV